MPSRSCMIATWSLCVLSPSLVGAAIQCSAVTCSATTTATSNTAVSLTCGSDDEVVGKVVIAGYGHSTGSWDCGGPPTAFAAFSCGDKSSQVRTQVERACLGQPECRIVLPAMMSNSSGECGRDTQLGISVKCVAKGGMDSLTLFGLAFVACVMLALGATLEKEDFRLVMRSKKKGILIGWFSQFGVMPLMSYIMVKASGMDPLVGAGLLMSGCAPGGSTSNLFTYWSQGDVALSITMSTCSTICSVFMFPFLVYCYIELGLASEQGTQVVVPFNNILVALVVVIVPAAVGVMIRNKCSFRFCGKWPIYVVLEKLGSALGAVFLLGALVSGVSNNMSLFEVHEHPVLFTFGLVFEPLGCLLGFAVAWLCGMDQPSRIAVSLETGVQNFGLVLTVVALSFTGCERQKVVAFALIGSFFYVFNSLWICLLFRFAPCCRSRKDAGTAEGGRGGGRGGGGGGEAEAEPEAMMMMTDDEAMMRAEGATDEFAPLAAI